MNTTYTTRDEAIQYLIIDPLEAGALIASPAIDYDIERIADTVLDTDDQGCYFQSATVEEFWTPSLIPPATMRPSSSSCLRTRPQS